MMEAPKIYLAVDEDGFEMIFTHPPKRFFGSMNKNFGVLMIIVMQQSSLFLPAPSRS